MIFGFTMARLPDDERLDLIAEFAAAFREAMAEDGLPLKEAAYLMGEMDDSQLGRYLTARETFDLARLVCLLRKRPTFADALFPRLCKVYGGWRGVLSHGLAHLFVPFMPMPGQARMARAALSDPRKEDQECVGASGSWRASA